MHEADFFQQLIVGRVTWCTASPAVARKDSTDTLIFSVLLDVLAHDGNRRAARATVCAAVTYRSLPATS